MKRSPFMSRLVVLSLVLNLISLACFGYYVSTTRAAASNSSYLPIVAAPEELTLSGPPLSPVDSSSQPTPTAILVPQFSREKGFNRATYKDILSHYLFWVLFSYKSSLLILLLDMDRRFLIN